MSRSFRYDLEPAYEPMLTPMERLLEQKVSILCVAEGISRVEMSPIQRLFLTHYRCSTCKLLPLYRLDLSHIKRARCGRCGHLVSFTSAGKYGKMRKKLALMLWQARCEGGI
ncbi:hypothetical protein NTE_00713 [Candidatus Nitrososphaera evergladensis SR1]|uniref:Uncharacterized protein n=1 Tax=Candidatus Nitrososphaera evergladensis SR1 TaxID=1459636 RepID=A0A075MNK8_9ARCH|nr:hypothetical protein [Candidatus Nitrososphaera evergladensis]AIF82793.1 hypothetical protein NTE_00713 [Candidatus Nitrososphaera evergladensis SR1]